MIPAARHYDCAITDSARWSSFKPRPGDVAVCAPPKSGTTWMQTICLMLLSGDTVIRPGVASLSPWLDARMRELDEVLARLDAQPGRRTIKSHTPLDGMPLHPELTYVAVYRHPIDVHYSMRKHAANMPLDIFDAYYPEDESAAFAIFLEGGLTGTDYDAPSLAGLLRHYRTFRAAAETRPNVYLFHYADLRRDLAGGVARVAEALGASYEADFLAEVTDAVSFDGMKSDPARFVPAGGEGFWKDDAGFFDSATSGKWVGRLTGADLARYDRMMDAALAPPERRWLEDGSLSAVPDAT